MDLTQLELFRAVAEEGSISAAAQRMHRVPSNLTTRIRQLESELGVDLFIREKLRLRLSPSGWNFLDYTRRILDLVEQARSAVSGNEPQGAFVLGSQESTAAVRIPPLLAAYHQRYPKVELDLSTGPSGDMIDGVLAGRFAAAFIDGPVNHPLLEGVPAYDEELVIIAGRDHPPITRAQQVNGRALYAFRANCSYRRDFENWFVADGATPGRIFEMESYHGMVACVSAGAGLALVPLSMLQSMPAAANVSIWPIGKPQRPVQTWLTWRRGMRSANLLAMLELLGAEQPAATTADLPAPASA